jgi:hypothetical protein
MTPKLNLPNLKRLCAGAGEPILGELVIDDIEKSMIARDRVYEFTIEATPNTVSQLIECVEIMRGALVSISGDYYKKHGGTLADYKREMLEETIETDTNIAREALSEVAKRVEGA